MQRKEVASILSNYEVYNNKLIVNGFEIEFDYDIADVKYMDKVYVVLLHIPNEVNEVDNIYGVDHMARLLWRIESPIAAYNITPSEQGYNYLVSSTYVHMYMDSEGVFTANTFFSIKYTFDHKTGKLLGREFTRW